MAAKSKVSQPTIVDEIRWGTCVSALIFWTNFPSFKTSLLSVSKYNVETLEK